MDRFHEMQVFLAVAEEEGFAAAARRLNTSPPSVTRAIAACCGVLLLKAGEDLEILAVFLHGRERGTHLVG